MVICTLMPMVLQLAAAAADTGNNDIGKSSHGSHSDEKLVKLTEPQPSQAQAPTEASQV